MRLDLWSEQLQLFNRTREPPPDMFDSCHAPLKGAAPLPGMGGANTEHRLTLQ